MGHRNLRLTCALSHWPGSHRKLPLPRDKAGPTIHSAGQGRYRGQQWSSELQVRDREGMLSLGEPEGDPVSSLLGSQASVAEELVDD